METRPEDPMHGDLAPGGETLPCDERLPRSQTPNRPSPTTSAQARSPRDWETKPRDGFPATVDMAAGGGRGPQ